MSLTYFTFIVFDICITLKTHEKSETNGERNLVHEIESWSTKRVKGTEQLVFFPRETCVSINTSNVSMCSSFLSLY